MIRCKERQGRGEGRAHGNIEQRFARSHGIICNGIDEKVEQRRYSTLVHDGHSDGLLRGKVGKDLGRVALDIFRLAL